MSLYRKVQSVNENEITLEGLGTVNLPEFEEAYEGAWMNDAMIQLSKDIFTVREASDIADIIGEYQVIEEGAQPEVVLEGIIKTGCDKLVKAFSDFWKAIKAFCANLKKQIEAFFKRGAEFTKAYGKELREKAGKVKGYSYNSFRYDETKGNAVVTSARNVIDARIDAILGASVTDSNTESIKALIAKTTGEANADKNFESTFISQEIKLGDAENTSELKKQIAKVYRGGLDKSETFEDFSNVSMDEMIKFVEGSKKAIEGIKNEEQKFDKELSAIIKKIKEVQKADKTEGADYKYITAVSSNLKTLLNIGKGILDVKASMYKEMAADHERTLRGFFKYKAFAKKEEPEKAAEPKEEPASESALFEQALSWL